jgi:hypothetical protein
LAALAEVLQAGTPLTAQVEIAKYYVQYSKGSLYAKQEFARTTPHKNSLT